MTHLRSTRALAALVLLTVTHACATVTERDELDVSVTSQALVPAKGSSSTLDIASWNIEWFGDTGNGPGDEALQRENAFDVISGADMDIWGVAEIVSSSAFNTLKGQLSGYAGLLANDASVVNGSTYYDASEQKVGLLYKASLATVQDARLILTSSDSNFAGRPPLQVTLRVTLNGHTEDIVVIVMHAKCCDDTSSWTRRQAASTALKSYLDSTFPSQKVWVVGDFNDDLDTSITPGKASPYANFSSDAADYSFATLALTNAHVATTVDFPDTIDHHLLTNDAKALYVANSIEAYRVDQFIANYGTTTSDHYPILSRYSWGSGGGTGGTGARLSINEICANEPGSDTAGEFVEVLNSGDSPMSLAGYTLSDSSAVRHTFAAGTTLAGGKAVVVFGGAAGIVAGTPNAVTASTGGLQLGNSGDSVTLKTNTGAIVQTYTYTSAEASSDGVSINRSPDGSVSGAFVKHNTLSSLARSPGAHANGAAW